jgi:uncharacterized protein (TIGR00369 family)
MAEALDPAVVAAVHASFARQGLMRAIRAELAGLGLGSCAIRLPFTESVGQQAGLFHGGIIGAVGDTAGGYAALTTMPAGSEVLTVEYKINFLRPAAGTRLLAIGTVLRAGRTLTVVRVDIAVATDAGSQPCAVLQQTLMRAETIA